jgi:predicted RNA-binding protein with TRAM domain
MTKSLYTHKEYTYITVSLLDEFLEKAKKFWLVTFVCASFRLIDQINRGIKLYRDENAPVSAGAIHDVTIEDIASAGDGIARIQGFVIFVPDTKIGDQVKIKIERVMRRFAVAALT